MISDAAAAVAASAAFVLLASNVRLRRVLAQSRVDARRDALTGLPNRKALDEEVAAIAATEDADRYVFVILDVDRFKLINDDDEGDGHADGDAVLVGIAGRVARFARPGDFACRLAGDEFVALLRMPDAAVPEVWARRNVGILVQRVNEPADYWPRRRPVTVSAGYVQMFQGATLPELQVAADQGPTGLYLAKRGLPDRRGHVHALAACQPDAARDVAPLTSRAA